MAYQSGGPTEQQPGTNFISSSQYSHSSRTKFRPPKWLLGLLILLAILLFAVNGFLLYTNVFSHDLYGSQLTPTELYNNITSKKPVFADSLYELASSNWDENKDVNTKNGGGCIFTASALHISLPKADPNPPVNYLTTCYLHHSQYTDFAFQVQMTVLQGSEAFAGIVFCVNRAKGTLYRFYIDFYNYYNFAVENNGETLGPSISQANPTIQDGLNHPYLLTVIAQQSNIYLYINSKYLTEIPDNSYHSGEIGMFASRNNLATTDVAFKNAKVWVL